MTIFANKVYYVNGFFTFQISNMNGIKETIVTKAKLCLRELTSVEKENNTSETLIIFFSWLGASSNALNKYFEIYHSLGHDILHVPGTVTNFAWPPTSVSLAREVLDYVCKDLTRYRFIMIHSTSIGSYNYTSCLMEVIKQPRKYWNFSLRLVGNVFDSITYGSYDHMRIGVSYGLTKNNLVRILLQQFIAGYFVVTKSITVDFYELGVKVFRDNQANVPSIFFYSRDDPLCDHNLIDVMVDKWRKKMTVPVLSVSWDTSVHACHLFKHKGDYMSNHIKFMTIVDEFREQKDRKFKRFSKKSRL